MFAQLRFAAHDGDHSADTSWQRNSSGRFGNYSAFTNGIVDFPEMPPSWRIVIAQSRGDVAEPVRRTKQVVGSYVPEAIDISALSRGRVVQPSV